MTITGGYSSYSTTTCNPIEISTCGDSTRFDLNWGDPTNQGLQYFLNSQVNQTTTFTPPTANNLSIDYLFLIESQYQSCIGYDTVLVSVDPEISPCEIGITIYNFLSPNGNNQNEVFLIEGIEDFPDNHLSVFNRWGTKVYEKQNYDNSWKGTNNGKKLPSGTYFYILQLDNETPPNKGYLELVK